MNITHELAISIIIPTYKPQGYVIDCLKSINNQSFDKKKFEVLIILNGDKVPHYSFLENYLLQCAFSYQLFYSEIANVSNARNIGIEQAKGKYLAFVDDDDIISVNYLQGLYDITKNDKIPLSYAQAFYEKITNLNHYYITNVYENIKDKSPTIFNIRSYFSSLCYKLIDRDTIGMHRFHLKFKNSEDALFMFAISEKKMKFQFADKTVVYYRRVRDNSVTTRKMSLLYKTGNCCRLIFTTIMIYAKSPQRYNFIFFVFRILAYIKYLFRSTLFI